MGKDNLSAELKEIEEVLKESEDKEEQESLTKRKNEILAKQTKKEKKKNKSEKKKDEPMSNSQLEIELILCDTLLLKGLILIQLHSVIKGGYNFRRSWKMYEKILAQFEKYGESSYNPDLVLCAKFGVGFFLLIMALLPENIMKIMNLIGFTANLEKGEKMLIEVTNSDSIRSNFASNILLMNYLFFSIWI